MLIEIDKLETVSNFAKRKNLSRQHVYRLAQKDEVTLVMIDDIAFIYRDEKSENFERKRKEKLNKSKI